MSWIWSRTHSTSSVQAWSRSFLEVVDIPLGRSMGGFIAVPRDLRVPEQEVDILIPAALRQQISRSKVEKISKRVKIIAEGASGPTTPHADTLLKPRGIYIIPDLLANAGGVICSYYEQVQSNNNYYWGKGDILSQLDVKMTSAYYDVSDFARSNGIDMRDAAIVMAVERVARACQERGWV